LAEVVEWLLDQEEGARGDRSFSEEGRGEFSGTTPAFL